MSDHTKMIRAGRKHPSMQGAVNPPVHRASTLLFEQAEDLYGTAPDRHYGTQGMVVHDALREAFCQLEQASSVVLTHSGLSACTLPLLAICSAGDHILVSDNIYGPTRKFCDEHLVRFGVKTEYFNPRAGNKIAEQIKPETRAIFMESPGSLTMELTDIPAIVALAKANNIWTLVDNTWAAGWFFKPLLFGVDFSIQAATKYPCGHADVLMGTIATKSAKATKLLKSYDRASGNFVAPDDAWLILRGMRTMGTRLERQQQSSLQVANWLQEHACIAQVLHPALPSHPDHMLWKRDFTGASGLFSLVLQPVCEQKVLAFLNTLQLFGLGFSWGGFESLAIHCDPQTVRTCDSWQAQGPLIRLSIGLEDPDDLIADLEQALKQLDK